MENLAQVVIYIIAIMGIILTTISFSEIYNFKKVTYKLFDKRKDYSKFIELTIKIDGLSIDEENEVLSKIIKGDYDDIEKIVDVVNVEKN